MTSYTSEYCTLMKHYFREPILNSKRPQLKEVWTDDKGIEHKEYTYVLADLPMFEGFAAKIGTSVSAMEQWKAEHEDFADAWDQCIDMQKQYFTQNALNGAYNAPIAKVISINLFDWNDSQRSETKSASGRKGRTMNDLSDKELGSRLQERKFNLVKGRKTA